MFALRPPAVVRGAEAQQGAWLVDTPRAQGSRTKRQRVCAASTKEAQKPQAGGRGGDRRQASASHCTAVAPGENRDTGVRTAEVGV